MAGSSSERLISRRILRSDEKGEALDRLKFKSLGVQVRLYVAGSAGTLELQHAASNEEALFTRLGDTYTLSSGTGEIQLHGNYLRYLRFATSSNVSTSPAPEASLDLIAKEYGANQAYRMLDRRVITPNETSEILDLGPFKTLCVSIWVAAAGSAGTIELQHAAISEPNAFTTVGSAVNLNATGVNVQYHTSFLRYVRWLSSGAVAGSPEVVIDVIAKEF